MYDAPVVNNFIEGVIVRRLAVSLVVTAVSAIARRLHQLLLGWEKDVDQEAKTATSARQPVP